ncbi:5966_t:CDS:2 [Acaulospora morrowiae]|uniref:Delta(14)-sterol reductase ERG24 n=1 Tax=Acaulospora morrowiae TaxID=94023 RepID=A0A9N8WLZ2_9GLOM|nr:5966_t:CDS:2 [Acaulospora morrowiae]
MAPSNDEKPVLNPKTTEFEFLGPIGALLMVTVLPILVYILFLGCQPDGCPSPTLLSLLTNPTNVVPLLTVSNILSIFDLKAFVAYLSYLAYLVLAFHLVPGRWIDGTQLRNGTRLKYKENGFSCMLLTLAILEVLSLSYGSDPLLFISDHFIGLVTASIIVSLAASFYVYYESFRKGKLLSLGGNSGIFIYDFMIGRELNPRIGSFDIKYFVELRPGITSWTIINIAMTVKQYKELGYVTAAMYMVLVFQGWYAIDSIYNEPAVLTTMDITSDGFGFMLSFGNFTWVGFLYALQARYLSLHPVHLSWLQILFIAGLNATGYYIFRSSNNEKNIFRNNPDDSRVKHLKYIKTKAGPRLIVSGWWGKARHINYLGDWLMAWAWCLPCGFDNLFPYFYIIYFTVLLVHRELRDEEKCSKKYGKDWITYCRMVKWRIIPGIY